MTPNFLCCLVYRNCLILGEASYRLGPGSASENEEGAQFSLLMSANHQHSAPGNTHSGFGAGSGARVLAFPLANCVKFDKLLKLSLPQFLPLWH